MSLKKVELQKDLPNCLQEKGATVVVLYQSLVSLTVTFVLHIMITLMPAEMCGNDFTVVKVVGVV